MKVRNGFVSNSSSSSFIVVIKNNESLENNLNKILDETFKNKKDSLFYRNSIIMVDTISNNITCKGIEEIFNCYVVDNLEELKEDVPSVYRNIIKYKEQIDNQQYQVCMVNIDYDELVDIDDYEDNYIKIMEL